MRIGPSGWTRSGPIRCEVATLGGREMVPSAWCGEGDAPRYSRLRRSQTQDEAQPATHKGQLPSSSQRQQRIAVSNGDAKHDLCCRCEFGYAPALNSPPPTAPTPKQSYGMSDVLACLSHDRVAHDRDDICPRRLVSPLADRIRVSALRRRERAPCRRSVGLTKPRVWGGCLARESRMRIGLALMHSLFCQQSCNARWPSCHRSLSAMLAKSLT